MGANAPNLYSITPITPIIHMLPTKALRSQIPAPRSRISDAKALRLAKVLRSHTVKPSDFIAQMLETQLPALSSHILDAKALRYQIFDINKTLDL